MSYAATILGDSPLAYWRLGETSGTTAADASGNGRAGTYAGGYTLGQAGAIAGDTDKAIALDGTTGRVAVPNTAGALSATAALTIEGWFNQTSVDSANHDAISKDAQDPAALSYSKVNYSIRFVSGKLQFIFISSDSNIFPTYSTSAAVITAGSYFHVVVAHTFGAGSGTRIYVNGSAASGSWTQGTGNESPLTSTRPLNLGAVDSGGAFYNFFNGAMDEVAIYGTALSAARVKAHYRAGRGLVFPRRLLQSGHYIT